MLEVRTLYPGRKAGMDAATIPTHTSQERQYQSSILSHVGSELTFCQFRTVRTMQHAAVLEELFQLMCRYREKALIAYIKPRAMRLHKPAFTRIDI